MIKRRNFLAQIVLMIVSCGLYSLYWYYATCLEMARHTGREENVLLWTVFLSCFPIPVCLYAFYKQGELFERISPETNRWVIFALWSFFPPASWLIIQLKLNRLAAESGPQPLSLPRR